MSGMPAEKRRYTWQDYQSWPGDERWEILDGEAFAMSPTPTIRHQRILLRLALQMQRFFQGKPCEVIIAPLDVKLDDENCVEPDLFVLCDPKKLRRNYVDGVPELVVEILSLGHESRDRVRKMRIYARFGVKEVWLITPMPSMFEVFVLDGATYRLAGSYTKKDQAVSPTFPEVQLDLPALFDFPPEPGDTVEVVKEPPGTYASARTP
jgi:Uma2 family endonuclease